MLIEIEELYNDQVLNEFLGMYGIEKNTVKFVGGFDSYVYSYKRDGKDFILKITHSLRRSTSYIQAEIDWLNYMAREKVSVANAVPSISGSLVETLGTEDSHFIAIAYEEAPGTKPSEEEWNNYLFEEWGKITGQLHHLTKRYKPSNANLKRHVWWEEDYINIEKYIPADQHLVIQKSVDLVERLKSIPRDENNFCLIHGDLHYLNFHLKDGNITLFDFDDIGYNYFINDLAVILFYAYWRPLKPHQDDNQFLREFLHYFIKGYETYNSFDSKWLDYLPDFLKLRHIVQYIAFLQSVNLESITEDELRYMEFQKMIIEKEFPIIDYDFSLITR
jgi:amicoumacin kinase